MPPGERIHKHTAALGLCSMGTQKHYFFFFEMMLIRPKRMKVSLGADAAMERREVGEDLGDTQGMGA